MPYRSWPTTDPQKIKERARRAVQTAVIAGQLIKPNNCERCGNIPRIGSDGRSLLHAHHANGYDKPLEVEWVCSTCHGIEHPNGPRGATHHLSRHSDAFIDEVLAFAKTGVSYRQVCAEFNIAVSTYYQWKNGRRSRA